MAGKNYERLSDNILKALELAIEQKDLPIADLLSLALDRALTRRAGGKDFTERREFSDEVEQALDKLAVLRKGSRG